MVGIIHDQKYQLTFTCFYSRILCINCTALMPYTIAYLGPYFLGISSLDIKCSGLIWYPFSYNQFFKSSPLFRSHNLILNSSICLNYIKFLPFNFIRVLSSFPIMRIFHNFTFWKITIMYRFSFYILYLSNIVTEMLKL